MPPRMRELYANFYSRPCGRGDADAMDTDSAVLLISTHAPAGGATLGCGLLPLGRKISTHAPAGGATCLAAGCVLRFPQISTHAPAGGATVNTAVPVLVFV